MGFDQPYGGICDLPGSVSPPQTPISCHRGRKKKKGGAKGGVRNANGAKKQPEKEQAISADLTGGTTENRDKTRGKKESKEVHMFSYKHRNRNKGHPEGSTLDKGKGEVKKELDQSTMPRQHQRGGWIGGKKLTRKGGTLPPTRPDEPAQKKIFCVKKRKGGRGARCRGATASDEKKTFAPEPPVAPSGKKKGRRRPRRRRQWLVFWGKGGEASPFSENGRGGRRKDIQCLKDPKKKLKNRLFHYDVR